MKEPFKFFRLCILILGCVSFSFGFLFHVALNLGYVEFVGGVTNFGMAYYIYVPTILGGLMMFLAGRMYVGEKGLLEKYEKVKS